MKLSEIKAEAERTLKYKRQCDCGVNDQKRILALVAVAEAAEHVQAATQDVDFERRLGAALAKLEAL